MDESGADARREPSSASASTTTTDPQDDHEFSPRLRFKKASSLTRGEFPDSGPEMALLRTQTLIAELLAPNCQRAQLERELEWLEKTHPTSVVQGMVQWMFSDSDEVARFSSVFLKNFVSRIGRWNSVTEEVRRETFKALSMQLKDELHRNRSYNAARVIAAICEAEEKESRNVIVSALCVEASKGMHGACDTLAHFSTGLLCDYRTEIASSLSQGLFAVSRDNSADMRILGALCEVVLNDSEPSAMNQSSSSPIKSPTKQRSLSRRVTFESESTSSATADQDAIVDEDKTQKWDLVRAACVFGARQCASPELRAKSLECFPRCWAPDNQVRGDRALLARSALDSLQVELDAFILERAIEFFTFIAGEAIAEPYLEPVLNTIISLLTTRNWYYEQSSESVIRELLVALVSTNAACADILACAFESCLSGPQDGPLERRFALICLGCICHSNWLSKEDGQQYSKILTSSPLEEPDFSTRATACWALEQACWCCPDIFFSTPSDFNRLVTTLVRMLSTAPPSSPTPILASTAMMMEDITSITNGNSNASSSSVHIDHIHTSSQCLVGLLEKEKILIGGRLASPHQYQGELGRVPNYSQKTNRFSAYFSQLIETLAVCETEEANQAIGLLIDNCANDVLGFVSWLMNRQIRALWGRLTAKSSATSNKNNFKDAVGRKRTWNAHSSNSSNITTTTTALDASLSQQQAMQITSSTPESPVLTLYSKRPTKPYHQRSLIFICQRLRACVSRLARYEMEDPALWKATGEASSVLLKLWTMERDERVHVMECLRDLSMFRGADVKLSNIVQAEVVDQLQGEGNSDEDHIVAGLLLTFTMAEDDDTLALLEAVSQSPFSTGAVRLAAVRAFGEVLSERRKRTCARESDYTRLLQLVMGAYQSVVVVSSLASPDPHHQNVDGSLIRHLAKIMNRDDDEHDLLWNWLDVSLDCLGECYSSCITWKDHAIVPDETSTPIQTVHWKLGQFTCDFIISQVCPSCRILPFHVKKTSVALKCLNLISRIGQIMSPTQIERSYEQRYEEFGPVFDVVAEAVNGKDATGDATQRAGKVASEALMLVFPKGIF